MGVKVRGIDKIKARMDDTIADISGRKAVRAVQSALFIIGSEAAPMVPRDTSTLLNSQYREINFIGTKISGRVGFSANYAASVHDASGKLKGQPRDNGRGNYWDPSGEPKFLEKAAKATRSQVIDLIKKELSL